MMRQLLALLVSLWLGLSPALANNLVINPYAFGALTLSQLTTATSTSSSITVPASVQQGDLLVLADWADNDDGTTIPTDVVPSGWTGVAEEGASSNVVDPYAARFRLSAKIAGPSDASASVTGMNDDQELKIIVVFRPSRALASISPLGAVGVMSGESNPSGDDIAALGGSAPLVVIGAFAALGSAGAPNLSSRSLSASDGEQTAVIVAETAPRMYLAWKIYNTAPANVSIDIGDEGFLNTYAGAYIEAD